MKKGLVNAIISRVSSFEEVDRLLRAFHAALSELQGVPIVRGVIVRDVVLADAVETPVHHGLGHRAALFLAVPRQSVSGATSGRLLDVTEINTIGVDTKQTSVLKATGFTVDLKVTVWAV